MTLKYAKMLKDFRKKFKLSQKKAAKILGYSPRSLQYIEGGERFINPVNNPDFFIAGLDYYSEKLENERRK